MVKLLDHTIPTAPDEYDPDTFSIILRDLEQALTRLDFPIQVSGLDETLGMSWFLGPPDATAAGGGGVTSVATGTGLTGGTITSTGTIAATGTLADIAGLGVTNGNFIVGDGSDFVAESGNTARTSLGVGTGDSPQFAAITVADAGTIGSASDTDAMAVSSGGVVNFTQRPTFAASITIQDGGSVGSSSDLNAMTISSGGVVAVTATTANTDASDGALTVAGGLGVAADASIGDDLRLISDEAVLSFGVNSDVTLTHVHDTGILLNSTMAIQFNDASQYINAPSNAILDINATDEIELNATLVDINANLDVSGTYTGGGLMTTGGNIVIPNAGNIGSASDTDAIAISSGGDVSLTQGLSLVDNEKIILGTNSDISLTYDESTTDALVVSSDVNDAALGIVLQADAGADAGDEWKLNIANGGVLTLGNDIASAGTHTTLLTVTPNSTAADSTHAFIGSVSSDGIIISPNIHTASVGATATPDFSAYRDFIWTLSENLTLGNPSTEIAGQSGVFVFIQDGSGGNTVGLGDQYDTTGNAGLTITTTGNAVNIVPYYVKATGAVLLGQAVVDLRSS